MFDTIKTYLTYGNRFCGLELGTKEGEEIAYVTNTKKSKQQVDLDETFQIKGQNDVFKKLNKNTPVYLVINNDQILFKEVPNVGDDVSKKIDLAFPNINLEDFYFELVDQNSKSFVAICRKAYVGQVMNEFVQRQIPVVNVSLGQGLCTTMSKYLDNGSVQSSNANVFIEDNIISKIEPIVNSVIQKYNINGIEISNFDFLSFCGALLIIRDNYHPASNLDQLKEQLKSSYIQKRWFKQGFRIALFTILGVLLINFMVFNHYFNSVNTLKETVLVNEATKQNMLVLNDEVSKLQKKVEDMFRNGSSKSSWYINQLVQSLPETVMLSVLNYQPLSKKIRLNQPILTENNVINVLGESSDSNKFSLWMAQLETMPWIEKVEIANYQDVAKERSEFQIKIRMAND